MANDVMIKNPPPHDAYVQAFKKAVGELQELQKTSFELKKRLAEVDVEIEQKLEVATKLAEFVAKDGDKSLRAILTRIQGGASLSARTSVAYDVVRKMLSGPQLGEEISTAEVLRRIKNENIGIEPKAVYNALNYLQKIGKLRRVSRGHYLIGEGGYAVQSTHEVDRMEDRDMAD